jgi:cytochrome b-561
MAGDFEPLVDAEYASINVARNTGGAELKSKPISTAQRISAGIAHLMNICVFVLICIYCGRTGVGYLGGFDWGARTFNWHPVMMVFGLFVCATEGLLAYRTLPFGRLGNKRAHALLQTAGTASAVVGLTAVFLSHNIVGHGGLKPNLYTAHGWIGIFVVTLYFSQYLVGLLAFGLQASTPGVRKALLPVHVFLGVFSYFGALVAALMGIAEKTGFGGAYPVDSTEYNPAAHYNKIGGAYRVAFWLAICMMSTALFSTYAAMDLRVGSWQEPRPNSE